MRIERMTKTDNEDLRDIHTRMGSKYPLPDFTGPMFVVGKVVRDDHGRLLGGLAVKVIGEAFLLLDPALSDYQKTKAVASLSESAITATRDASLEEVSAWIPQEVETIFAPLLQQLGWMRSPWPCWSKVIGVVK